MTVDDMTVVEEFLRELENNNISFESERINEIKELSELQLKRMKSLEEECLNVKQEAAAYKEKYLKIVEQSKVEEDAINSLESQIANLNKTVFQLTQDNAELVLSVVSGQLSYLDLISKLEDERIEVSEQTRIETSFSSNLHQKLLNPNAEVEDMKSFPVSDSKKAYHCQSLSQKIRSPGKPSVHLDPSKASSSSPFKLGTKLCSRPQLAYLPVLRSIPLAFPLSFNNEENTSDRKQEFNPVTLDLAETISDYDNEKLSEESGCFPSDRNNNNADTFTSMSSISETKFLIGLENPIEITDHSTDQ